VTPEAIVEFAEALARIAASGGGAKALAAHLALAARGGVLVEDAQWRPLATAGAGPMPASARGVAENGGAAQTRALTAGTRKMGWLSLFVADPSPEAGTLLRLTAAAIALELARDGSAARARQAGFWDLFLAPAFNDSVAAREEAAARGIDLVASYLPIVLEAEAADGERGGACDPAELRALASDAFRGSADLGFAERGPALFVFVPAARAVDASNAKTAAGLLPKNAARRKAPLRISGGVGTLQTPDAVHAGVAAAEAALAIGRRVYGSGRVAVYDELGAYPLIFQGADVERMRSFAARVLEPLRQYDEKHETELERTLKLYFDVGQNVKSAAAALNVHRHTVFYRLRQICEICARSLESPHDQLTLRMAVAIDELHESI
jgi:hypothetical protein